MPFPYAEINLQERLEIANQIKTKYPGYIPVLIDIFEKEAIYQKYIISETDHLSHLLFSIRDRNKLSDKESLYLFANKTLLPLHQTMSQIYSQHSSPDNFLYITIMIENVFG